MIRALRIFLYVIAALIVLVGLLLAFLATPPGRAVVASIAERVVAGTGLTLSIDRLTGWPPFSFGADRIVVGDAEGPFAEIEGLQVDLAIGGLLRREVVFDALHADRVAVSREPVLPASSGSSSDGAGLALAARDFSVDRLELGAALATHPAALAVRGAFEAAADGRIAANVEASRVDGARGQLAARLQRASGGGALIVDATLQEGQDGILLGLMGRENGPAYRLQAHTDINDGAFDGTLNLVSDGDARFAGKFSLSPDVAAGQRLVLSGDGDLAELVPPGLTGLLSGTIDVAVDVQWNQVPGASLPEITVHEGRLSTGAIHAEASGRLGTTTSDLTLRLDMAAPGGGPLTLPLGSQPLAFDSVTVTGRVAPVDGTTRLDLLGRGAGLAMGDIAVPGLGFSLAVEAPADDPLSAASLPFALRVEADRIDLGDRTIPGGETTPLVATGQGTLDLATMQAQTTADVTVAGGRASYTGSLGADAVTGRAELAFADLATLAEIFDLPLAGGMTVVAEGSFAGADGLDLKVSGRGAGFATGIDIADRLLGPDVVIAGTVGDASGALSVTDLTVTGAQASLAGSATLDGGTVDAALTGRVADLGVIAEGSTGVAELTAEVTGDVSAPKLAATVKVAEGSVAGQAISDAEIAVEGAPTDAGWEGRLTLAGTLAGLPLSGTATALASDAGVGFPAIDLTVAENRITGALATEAGGLLSGSLDVAGTNLETLAAIALVEASGAVTAKATFAPENGRQAIDVSFGARDVAVEGLTLAHAEGEARIDDAFGDATVAGHVDLGTMAVGSLTIDTAALTARVVDGATDFEVSAAGPDLMLSSTGSLGIDAGTTTVRIATLDGTAFNVPVALAAPAEIALADGTVRLDSVALAAGTGQVTATGTVSPTLDLKVAVESVAAHFFDEVVPGLNASGMVNANATVTGTPDAPAFAWTATWDGFALDATRSAGLPPLAVSARGEGTAAATSVDARANATGVAMTAAGTVPFDGSPVDITVGGTINGADLGQPALAGLLAGETTLSANIGTGPGGRLTVSDLAIAGSGLNATGSLTLEGETIDATVDGRIADLSLLADQSSGEATFNARVTGTMARPDVAATVVVPNGSMLGQPVDGASVSFKGAPTDAGGWDGTLTLGGAFAGHPLSGTAQAALAESGGLTIPDVNLQIGENRITGAVERTPAGLLQGSLDVSAPSLASLAALALVEATGAAQGRVVFTPDGDRQSVSLSVNGQGIRMPSLSVAKIDAEAQVEDAFGVPMVRGRAQASALDAGSVKLDTATVTASVVDGATKFEVSARGPDLNLSGAGSLANDDGAQVIGISRLNGSAFGFPVDIASPATIRLADGETQISGVNLSVGGGRIVVEGTVADQIALEATVTKVAGSFLNHFVGDLEAEGTISGSVKATGTAAAPRAAWRIDWTGFNVGPARKAGVPAMTLGASGVATATQSTVDARLAGGGISLAVTGTVPFAGPGLQVRAQGTAPLALATAEAGGDIAVDGTARIDLTVSGSTSNPAINGTFDIVNARFADASDGIGVANLNGRILFDGQTARIQQLTGNLTQGGNLTIAGTINVDPAAGIPADMTVRIRNGRYLDGTMINANLNADITLRGPLTGGATLAGTVDLGRTQILLPESFGGGPPITVAHINAAPGFVPPMQTLRPPGAPPPSTSSSSSSAFNLDLTVNSTNVIYVRGFGLDAELGGSIRVEGTTSDPRPIGGFEMRRGRITVLGRRFDFDRGIMTFQGDMNPVLDFAASTTTADITATVLVTGPAADPEISLSAVPSMPEEEIISRIIFGQSIGSLSAFQTVQLVDAIAEFSGAYGRDGSIFARVRRTVGLDDLDIQQNASGGTTVTVGKQISDKVHVGVQTETDGSSRVTLDVDLTRSLKAQIEGGSNGGGGVGLTFEKEY